MVKNIGVKIILMLFIFTFAYAEEDKNNVEKTVEEQKNTEDKVEEKVVKNERRFIFCIEGYPKSLNPQLTFDMTSFYYDQPVYETLVQFADDNFEIKPSLAEKWVVNTDKTEYTFYLRKGVKFHTTDKFTPNRDMNAYDVFFSFDKQFNVNNEYHAKTNSKYISFSTMIGPLLKGMEVVDDYTIKFYLNKPYSFFLNAIASNYTAIMSLEYAEKLKSIDKFQHFDEYPVGTGPFKLASYINDSYNYAVNEDYWGNKAKYDLLFLVVENTNVRYQKMLKGECDLMNFPNLMDLEQISADKNLYLITEKVPSISYLVFNTSKPLLNKVEIREALSMAINKLDILDLIYQGTGEFAVSPFLSTYWNVNGELSYEYNLKKARSILKNNNAENMTLELYFNDAVRPYNPNPRKMAELIKRDLQKIGVNVKINNFELGEMILRMKDSKHDLFLAGLSTDIGNPVFLLKSYLSCKSLNDGRNYANWCNSRFDNLVEELVTVSGLEEREEILKNALEIMNEQKPWLPIAHSQFIAAASKNIQNIKLNRALFYKFNYIEIAK